MTAADRDSRALALVDRMLDAAVTSSRDLDERIEVDLDTLFDVKVWGFREVMLTVVVARVLQPKFTPSGDLYACNPRALYEGPIREVLTARRIPHRLSGPLNVAKAAKGLDNVWAAQRSPQRAAQATVRLVVDLERTNGEGAFDLGVSLCRRFLEAAQTTAALAVDVEPQSQCGFLSALCASLIDDVPDGGNTPQRICGLLLVAHHEGLGTGIDVFGHEQRASTTSGTSKKPGDIREEQADGTVVRVYEVTTKAFGASRVHESLASLRSYDDAIGAERTSEVVVLCRPDDVHPNAVASEDDPAIYLGTIDSEGVTYIFVDIYQWIMSILLRTPPGARIGFHEALHAYVDDPNTAERVKEYWQEWHEASGPIDS